MTDKVAIRRLPTGVPGLDEALGGGLPEFSFNPIKVGTIQTRPLDLSIDETLHQLVTTIHAEGPSSADRLDLGFELAR